MPKRILMSGRPKINWRHAKLLDYVYWDMNTESLNYTSAWESSLGIAIGVIFRIISDHVYIVSKERLSGIWGGNGATGGKTTNTHYVAQADVDGLYNTNKIIQNLGTAASAAYACRTYTTEGTNRGDWYMPAEGENYLMYQSKSYLNSKLSSIGGTQFGSEDYWSSTVVDNSNAWHVRMSAGNIFYDTRDYQRHYRPCLCVGFKGEIIRS